MYMCVYAHMCTRAYACNRYVVYTVDTSLCRSMSYTKHTAYQSHVIRTNIVDTYLSM